MTVKFEYNLLALLIIIHINNIMDLNIIKLVMYVLNDIILHLNI